MTFGMTSALARFVGFRTESRPQRRPRRWSGVDPKRSLLTLREKLIKIGAKVVRYGRYVTFQLAKVAMPRSLFANILGLIDDLRPRPAPAQAGDIDGEEKTTGGVRLNGGKSGHMVFQTRADLQNQAIGWLPKGGSSHGSGRVVRFSQIWMSAGECRLKWSTGESRFRRAGGDPTLVADDNLHPSGNVYTPWADTIVRLTELALLKEETP